MVLANRDNVSIRYVLAITPRIIATITLVTIPNIIKTLKAKYRRWCDHMLVAEHDKCWMSDYVNDVNLYEKADVNNVTVHYYYNYFYRLQ